jgi:hypothetical protein
MQIQTNDDTGSRVRVTCASGARINACLHQRGKTHAVWPLFFLLTWTAAVGVIHATSRCYMHVPRRASHRAPSMHRVYLVKLMHRCRVRGHGTTHCFYTISLSLARVVALALQAKCTPISQTPTSSVSTLCDMRGELPARHVRSLYKIQ